MKTMKKIIYILAIIGLAFGACDKIEEPFLEEQGGTTPGPGPGEKVRKVILEEFTGHICVNCPEATIQANDLKTLFGEQLILLSIHGGPLAVPLAEPFETDYRTEAGTAIYNYYNPVGVPIGMVNRTDYEGNTLLFKDSWEGAINALIDLPPEASIEIESEYNDGNRKLDIHVHSEFLADLDRTLNLSVLLLESGMVSAQKNDLASIGPTPDWLNYEHKHLLRLGVNGTWGELLAEQPTNGTVVTKDFSVTLDNAWDVQNMDIIALIIDAATYEVIQAEEMHIN